MDERIAGYQSFNNHYLVSSPEGKLLWEIEFDDLEPSEQAQLAQERAKGNVAGRIYVGSVCSAEQLYEDHMRPFYGYVCGGVLTGMLLGPLAGAEGRAELLQYLDHEDLTPGDDKEHWIHVPADDPRVPEAVEPWALLASLER